MSVTGSSQKHSEPMREIITLQLWIGNAVEAQDQRRVNDLEIAAVVDLAREQPPLQLSRDLVYCRFPLIDGPDNPPALLAAAIQTTALLIREKARMMVCCGAGLSRSPAIVAAAMALVREEPTDECLNRIADMAPLDIVPALWNDVACVYNRIVGAAD